MCGRRVALVESVRRRHKAGLVRRDDELYPVPGAQLGQRVRPNVFKMVREAELLSKAGAIMPAVLSERVAAVLSAGSPSDLRFFPTQQTERHGAAPHRDSEDSA